MSENKEYWESLCVPYDEIVEEKDKNIARCKVSLTQFSISHLSSLNTIFFNVNASEDKQQLINNICSSDKIVDFILLQSFHKGRKYLIDEFLRKHRFSGIIDDGDFLVNFLPLLKTYINNPDSLLDLLLYCEFKKKQKGEAYLVNPKWGEEDTEKFKGSIRSLKIKVARKYKRKKFI